LSDSRSDSVRQIVGGLALLVEHDPAVWLAGPAEPEQAQAWVEGALAACASDFEVEPGSADHQYLAAVLQEFAHRDLGTANRLLRLRELRDAPLIALLDVYVGLGPHEVTDNFLAYDETDKWYDPPRVSDVDASRGLRRALRFRRDDGIRSVVRYHRRIDDLQLDIVLSCSGADLKATASGLADLDALAQAVWVVTASEERR
jgi:hypothetical protein